MKKITTIPEGLSFFPLTELQINEFELYGRTYKTVICSEICANPLIKMFPELSVIGEDSRGIHLTQSTNKGLPVSAIDYLDEVYGLQPSDLDLQPGQFDIAEVERLAKKYLLTRKEDFTLGKAIAALRPFQNK